MCCSRLKSQSENLQDFVCSRKKLVVLSACAIFVLICGLILKTSPANANVCFLPDPAMCDDGEGNGGGTPGGGGTGNTNTGTDVCEGYTTTFLADELPQNACGDACRRCEDPNSPNFGKYLCPESTCGWCDRDGGYTSIKEQNRCGDACERCDDKYSKSFGKYKCPPENCDECVGYDMTEAQIRREKCVNCVPCPYDNTRYKCTTCNVCSGYPYSATDYQVTSGAYECERCPDGDWYKCTPRNLCGDYFDYANDMTSPNSETFNAYGKRHITCSQCTSSGKYDTRYGYFYCQDDGCQGYNTHQSDTKITSGEYACCQCSPQYLAHDASLDQSRFRVDNGDWYNSCEEYCKSSEDNFFTVDYLRNGKYSCNNVKANKYPDAIGERTAAIRLSCGNKTHSCYYPITVCSVDEYKWTETEATAKGNDDHYKKDPCASCNESTSCAYMDYRCDDPMCDPDKYVYYISTFEYSYSRNYLGDMAGYDPDTCSNCLATGRSEASRLYANDCECIVVPDNWYDETTYNNKFYDEYGYRFSISDNYLYTTSGCEPIYSCGMWYYNYNSSCMKNDCNTSWASTTRSNFQSHPTDGDLYGFRFEDPSCSCQYLDKIYYNSGSTACYDDCSSCPLGYGYDQSYADDPSYTCNYKCTDCSGSPRYDCTQCAGGGSTDCTGENDPGQWYECSDSCVDCTGKTLYSGCSPKDCPTGEVKSTECDGEFIASGAYSGTVACGYCCPKGYHWNGTECVVDDCPAGTVTEGEFDDCSEYTLKETLADGTKCYEKSGDKDPYCDAGWSLTAGTCYSSSKNAHCAKNGEKCYNNVTTPVCGTNESLYGAPTNCHCDCGDGYCRNPDGQCISAEGLTCPSDTTDPCYVWDSTTVNSGDCSKNCSYKKSNMPACGENAHIIGSDTTCGCECNTGYSGDGLICTLNTCETAGSSGVAEYTCGIGYTFESDGKSYINTDGQSIRCGTCTKNQCPADTMEEDSCDTDIYNFTQTGSYINIYGQTIKCGTCNEKQNTCNEAQNQYASEYECIGNWHDRWDCVYSSSTGCWLPICNESNGYYDVKQTCEEKTNKSCEISDDTKDYIPCYKAVACDKSQNQYANEQECTADWQQWWTCYHSQYIGCWIPICNESAGYYDDQQTCEVETDRTCALVSNTQNYIPCYQAVENNCASENMYPTEAECMDKTHEACAFDSDAGCWYSQPGDLFIGCDDCRNDYGHNQGGAGEYTLSPYCEGTWTLYYPSGRVAAKGKANECRYIPLSSGHYTLDFKNDYYKGTAYLDYPFGYLLYTRGFQSYIGSSSVEDQWYCGSSQEQSLTSSVSCTEHCYCMDRGTVDGYAKQCYQDYSIGIDFDSISGGKIYFTPGLSLLTYTEPTTDGCTIVEGK